MALKLGLTDEQVTVITQLFTEVWEQAEAKDLLSFNCIVYAARQLYTVEKKGDEQPTGSNAEAATEPTVP